MAIATAINSIYIPIWLYSNLQPLACKHRAISIYIPIWLYSNNIDQSVNDSSLPDLHSNLVIFKFHRFNTLTKFFQFTFQSGYIQI